MAEPHYIAGILVLLTAGIVAVLLFQRVGLGTVLGFLVAGALVGPRRLGFIVAVDEIRHLAEFGVVFLLFIIGIELKPSRLRGIWGQRSYCSIQLRDQSTCDDARTDTPIRHLFNTRFLTDSALIRNGALGNQYVLIAVGSVTFFQLLFTYVPLMQHFFATAPIDAAAWLRILGAGILVFVAVETEKALMRKRIGREG